MHRIPLRQALVLSRQQNVHIHPTVPQSDQLQEHRPWHVDSRVVTTSGEEQPVCFERDFEEIDELGSGEFGKVIKV